MTTTPSIYCYLVQPIDWFGTLTNDDLVRISMRDNGDAGKRLDDFLEFRALAEKRFRLSHQGNVAAIGPRYFAIPTFGGLALGCIYNQPGFSMIASPIPLPHLDKCRQDA